MMVKKELDKIRFFLLNQFRIDIDFLRLPFPKKN